MKRHQLPMIIDNEKQMVATIVHWIDLFGRLMTSEAGRLLMRRDIQERLRQGATKTMWVIKAAEAGHQDADFGPATAWGRDARPGRDARCSSPILSADRAGHAD